MFATRLASRALTNQIRYTNIFSKVQMAAPDQVYGMIIAYDNDKFPSKVNLGLGAYKNWDLKPVVLDVVRKVEEQLVADKSLNMEYIPIDGIPGFVSGSQKLIFGSEATILKEKRVVSVQTLSGTGALRLGFDLIKQYLPSTVHLPDPSWPNHQRIVSYSGLPIAYYPYYDAPNKKIALTSLLNYLNTCQEGNIVLFQVCAHNPTATDPTPAQWKEIGDVMEKKKLITFFDSTYQGLSSANFQKDNWAVRHFAQRGLPMFVEQSYAKNMGMYGHRVGCLHILAPDRLTSEKVLSQLKVLVRGNYSSPPMYGARIAEKIINSESLLKEWQNQLGTMVQRLSQTRIMLRSKLQSLSTPGNWEHLTNQTGFFVFTDLNPKQCENLMQKYHIHMMSVGESGRMATIGINSKNIDYVANALHETLTNVK